VAGGTVDRTTNGKGAVSSFTLDEIRKLRLRKGLGGSQTEPTGERIPTLEETMRAVGGVHGPATAGRRRPVGADRLALLRKHLPQPYGPFRASGREDAAVRAEHRRMAAAVAPERSARLPAPGHVPQAGGLTARRRQRPPVRAERHVLHPGVLPGQVPAEPLAVVHLPQLRHTAGVPGVGEWCPDMFELMFTVRL
jgi:hypothetical protein